MDNNSNIEIKSVTSMLDELRLPDNYSKSIGGIKLPIKPSFGKLNQHRFSRVHPDPEFQFPVLLVEDKDTKETYIATRLMSSYLGKSATPKILRLAVDNAGVPRIIAQPIANIDSQSNLWATSMNDAIKRAENTWIRIESNMDSKQYTIFEANGDLGDPTWPEQTMGELIDEIFANKIISSPDHPYIKQLQGRV